MNDEKALRAIGRGDEDALAWVIDRYAAYVSAVVFNILGAAMQTEDLEETVSDVFLALWANSGKVKPGKLKAYLGGIARNKAKEKLRSACMEISLEDDLLVYNGAGPEPELEAREEAGFVRRALLAMQQPDREIFLRHYYYSQPVSLIAREMDMNVSTVKTRLRRGRGRLKEALCKGGYEVEV